MNVDHIRHSLAHVLASAVQKLYPEVKFGIGPVTENGFFYDFDLAKSLGDEGLKKIEAEMKKIVAANLKFERLEMSLAKAKLFFKNQPYKLELIADLGKYGTTDWAEIQKGLKPKKKITKVSLYQTGNFTDLCRGGHVKSTKEINLNAFKLDRAAGAYWRGNEKNRQLTRIYGLAFKTANDLQAHLKQQEEIANRDHRKLGQILDLFSFQDIAPGAPFWHPAGMIIFKEMEKFWREMHDQAGYQEISTPILVKGKLFEKSGHLKYYRQNMFGLKVDNEDFYLKPMNCPEGMYIYRSHLRSWRDLPLRLSEIGRLHRNELSGTLGGMFRVRQLTMDDAHIFCRHDQIGSEISSVLKLVKTFYKIFGLRTKFYLATRPDEAMGDVKVWRQAEKSLKQGLKKNSVRFEIKPKDSAFYGPKIDIHIKDVLGRDWQMATIQLDFQMPERFNLSYADKNGQKIRPVMIHRAILGSFERFIGLLLEHFGGQLPLWLSPIQAVVIPIGEKLNAYAETLVEQIKKQNIRAGLDNSNETLGKKIRNAELKRIPYLLIVGQNEKKNKTVALRKRGQGDLGQMPVVDLLKKLTQEIKLKKLP